MISKRFCTAPSLDASRLKGRLSLNDGLPNEGRLPLSDLSPPPPSCLKQSLQRTGLLPFGLKGTSVLLLHFAHVAECNCGPPFRTCLSFPPPEREPPNDGLLPNLLSRPLNLLFGLLLLNIVFVIRCSERLN